MGLSHEQVGSKILAKIKTYILTRAELLFNLCYEIPCKHFSHFIYPYDSFFEWYMKSNVIKDSTTSYLVFVLPPPHSMACINFTFLLLCTCSFTRYLKHHAKIPAYENHKNISWKHRIIMIRMFPLSRLVPLGS